MRTSFGWILVAAFGSLSVWACTVESKNNSSSSASSTSGPSSTTGTSADCSKLLQSDACNDCVAQNCCSLLDACNKDETCWACITGGDACDSDHTLLGDINQCAGSFCESECSIPPPVYPEGDADCAAPVDSPSQGACVTLGGNASCNPVTNEGCPAGYACDYSQSDNFICYEPPNDALLCGTCDPMKGPFCAPGHVCIGGLCARYCCSDADCSPGAKCDGAYSANKGTVGACIGGMVTTTSSSSSSSSSSSGTGGTGGTGGMGGMGGMGSASSSTTGTSSSSTTGVSSSSATGTGGMGGMGGGGIGGTTMATGSGGMGGG